MPRGYHSEHNPSRKVGANDYLNSIVSRADDAQEDALDQFKSMSGLPWNVTEFYDKYNRETSRLNPLELLRYHEQNFGKNIAERNDEDKD